MPVNDTRMTRGNHLELRYLSGGVTTYLPGEKLGPRQLHDFELVWITSGRATYHHKEQSYELSAGSIVLARPGFEERYTWDPEQTSRHAFFHFNIKTLPRDWPKLDSWPVVPVVPAGDYVRPMFRHVVDHWCSRADHRRLKVPLSIHRLVEAMIDALLAEPRESSSASHTVFPQPVQSAIQWISQVLNCDPDRHVTLRELADAGSVSPKHLCRLFNRCLGASPMQALRLMRLERSMAMLVRSNLSVKQIAARVGFTNPYHFSRCFAQVYGIPPSQARRQMEQGSPPPPNPLAIEAWSSDQW